MSIRGKFLRHLRQIQENPVQWADDQLYDFGRWVLEVLWSPLRHPHLTLRKRRVCSACRGTAVKVKWGDTMRCDLCNGRGWLGKRTWLGRW